MHSVFKGGDAFGVAEVQSTKVRSTEVRSTEVRSTEVRSTEVQSTEVRSSEVQSTQVRSTEVQSTEVHLFGVDRQRCVNPRKETRGRNEQHDRGNATSVYSQQ